MRHPKLSYLIALFLLTACYREDIQFEGDPPDSYTQVSRIDSVTAQMSTVFIDSFPTGGATSFLLGSYDDPYFGEITARPFLQIDRPATSYTVAEHAVFDSLVLIIRLNKHHYGDSTKTITIDVHELDESIVLGYNDELYNTSNFQVKPSVLGTKQLRVYPNINDSIVIRLDQAKGQELFSKLKQQSDELLTTENFLNYFKGIRLSIPGGRGIAYGLQGAAGNFTMRLHYHTTIPYPQEQYVDFLSLANTLSFRQILVNRNGVLPDPAVSGKHELSSSETNNMVFTQPATGVLMKITFPSLRNILNTDKPINLLHAELIIRPIDQSFSQFELPPALFLSQTDESNFVGGFITDSTGQAPVYASPVIDRLYGVNNYFRFNITNYINALMHTPGTAGEGFFVMESSSEQANTLNRAVLGDAFRAENKAQLVLSIVTVNLD